MTAARYGHSNPAKTYAISNFRPVMDWVWGSAERTPVLFGASLAALQQVLGDPVQTWVGGSENTRFRLWREDAEGLTVWVMSSRRGVDYEVEHAGNPWDGSIGEEDCGRLVRFVAGLYLRLESVSPVEKFGPVVVEADDPVLQQARSLLQERASRHGR